MLTFQEVSFSYFTGRPVLTDIQFALPTGSCTLLAGRNGGGKSTIVQLCNGLLRPTTGNVLLRGIATSGIPLHDIVRDVAIMFQHPGDQITERTVEREIRVGLDAIGLDQAGKRATAALEAVELASRASAHPYDLEPTERKLVTLAATLAMATPIVVLDEPLVGLGPDAVRIVERCVRRIRQEGRSVLFVAHDILQAWTLADRVVVLQNGRVSLSGRLDASITPSDVFAAAGMHPPTATRAAQLLPHLPD